MASSSHKVDDTAEAVRFMNSSGRHIRLLVGHSFGGSAVIEASHLVDTVRAVVSIGAPFEPAHVEHTITTPSSNESSGKARRRS
jgi:predicted alpha/beta hydrolase family esterase